MKKWPILRRRLEKYENLEACDMARQIKYENLASEALEGSTRSAYFFCHVYDGFFIFAKMSYFFCLEDRFTSLTL